MAEQELQLKIILENGQFKVAVADSTEAVKKMGRETKAGGEQAASGIGQIVGGFRLLQNVVKGFIGLQVVQYLFNIGKAAFRGAAELEKNKIAFETMLGSGKKAAEIMKDIQTMAAKTPFETPGLIEGAKRLLAFGVAQQNIIPTMTRLGDAAMGNQEVFDRLTLAYGKVAAKGRASMEEINQFIEAGVPITAQLAKNLGVTTAQLSQMIERGQIGFSKVDQALKSLTTGTGQFAGMMARQSQTLGGLMSTLADNIKLNLIGAAADASGPMKIFIGLLSKSAEEGGLLANSISIIGKVVSTAIGFINHMILTVQRLWAGAKEIYYEARALVTTDPEKYREYMSRAAGAHSEGARLEKEIDTNIHTTRQAIGLETKPEEKGGTGVGRGTSGPLDSAAKGARNAAAQYKNYAEQILNGANIMLTGLTDIYSRIVEIEQQRIDNLKTIGDAWFEYQKQKALEAAGFQEKTQSQRYQQEIQDLQKQISKTSNLQKRKDLQEQIREKQQAKKKAEIEEKAAKEKAAFDLLMDLQNAQLARKQFYRNQQMQMGMIWMQAGTAVLGAWSGAFQSVPFPPAAAILAAVMTALILGMAAAQSAMVMTQKPPMFERGAFIPGTPAGVPAIVAERNKAEWIAPVDDPEAMAKVRTALGIQSGPIIDLRGAHIYDEIGFKRILKKGLQGWSFNGAY